MIIIIDIYYYYISWERTENFFIDRFHIDRYIIYTYITYINLH